MHWRVIIITCCFAITCNVIESFAHYILDVNVTKPWLTIDRFAKLLELSLNTSRCTNNHVFGVSTTTDSLFNKFVRIYPNTYFVGNGIWECTGYLMISTSVFKLVSAMQTVRVTVPTTEILIIVDDDVTVSSKLFNFTMYGNANVNIVTRNGRWKLSENYLDARVFKSVQSDDDFEYNKGIANFQRRNLQAAAEYHPPFCYLKTTISQTLKGVTAEVFTADKRPEFDGIDLNLFRIVADRLNATYTIRKPVTTYSFKSPNVTKWYYRTVNPMLRKEVDISFTNVWITHTDYDVLNLSKSILSSHVRFLVPRPKTYKSFWALTTPFTIIVWSAILTMLMAQSLSIYARTRLFPRGIPKRFHSFAMTWIELMGRLLSTTAPNTIRGLRIAFQLWHFTSLLLVTAYSSNLAVKLSSASYEKRIDTPKDFVEANLTWGRTKNLPRYLESCDDTYVRQISSRFVRETNSEDRVKKILQGNYAIIGKMIGDVYFPEEDIGSGDLTNYRVMKQDMTMYYTAFAVQPWLLKSVDKIVRLLCETGFVEYHLRDVIHRRLEVTLRDVLIEHEDKYTGPSVLSLKPLAISFIMLAVGLFISTIVFILEIISATGKDKSIRQVLADIKKNRENWNIKKPNKNKSIYPIYGQFKLKGKKFNKIRPSKRILV